jgi:hypothetical protein
VKSVAVAEYEVVVAVSYKILSIAYRVIALDAVAASEYRVEVRVSSVEGISDSYQSIIE